ncbi:MAG: hypothetical protein HQ472_05845 [Ignavibacteria bacterium]|nr:hypothetical protein [Ignavibacteria bacterium]
MKNEVKHGVGELSIIVTKQMTAELDGTEIHPLYSTFWIAKHAETAARKAIELFFDENEDAVGSELSIQHLAMAPVGAQIHLKAAVVNVTGRRITCEFEVWQMQPPKLIARGTQVQVVVTLGKIQEMIRDAYSEIQT